MQEKKMSELDSQNQSKSPSLFKGPKLKTLDKVATAKVLRDLLASKDVDCISSVKIDQLEAARFIERQAKILRFVCISAGLPSVKFLVEEIYYAAFDTALLRSRPDYKAFREQLQADEV
jgi:hypothetical protein